MREPTTNSDDLAATRTLTDLDASEALRRLAILIDLSDSRRDEDGLRNGIRLGQELLSKDLTPGDEALLHYFIGNAWSFLRGLRLATDTKTTWDWEQPDAREEILAFRRALGHRGFRQLPRLRQCQIATNLGNLMSTLGRFVEALNYFDSALDLDPGFGMALGNRGYCLLYYAKALYDDGHRAVFARSSADLIARALALPLEPDVAPRLQAAREVALRKSGRTIAEVDRAYAASLGPSPEGQTPEEASYRAWALRERLFLNPLNDLGPFTVAANDVLRLPTMTVGADVGSGFHGFYNQLKQEFAAARYLCYDGLHQVGRHHADRDVGLVDTWNNTVFGLSMEKVKLAFRAAYSLLDKTAVFLARYFLIDATALHRVNARTVWYVQGKHKNGVRDEFASRENWPLRGLFWLSKDLHEWDDEYHAAIEPVAREMATLRNQLEHQYARIVEPRLIRSPSEPEPIPPDPFGHVVGRGDLEAKTLRMLRTARAALIYLSLTIHCEERQRTGSQTGRVHRGSFPVLG